MILVEQESVISEFYFVFCLYSSLLKFSHATYTILQKYCFAQKSENMNCGPTPNKLISVVSDCKVGFINMRSKVLDFQTVMTILSQEQGMRNF